MSNSSTASPSAKAARPLLRRPAYWVALVILCAGAATLQASLDRFKITLRKEAIYPEDRRTLDRMSRDFPPFVFVSERREPPETEETLGTSNYVSRTYVIEDGVKADGTAMFHRLEFHAAYYTGMIDTVPHVAERCFVGAGMLIDQTIGEVPLPLDHGRWSPHPDNPAYKRMANSSRVFVTLPRDPEGLTLRTTRFRVGSQAKVFAGYFFVANGGWVSSAENVRLLAFDRSSRYAYYAKVQFSSDTVASGEELARLGAKFLDQAFADIMLCTPDWVRVEDGTFPTGRTAPAPADQPAVDSARRETNK